MSEYRVGTCEKCGERVWLTPDGGCSRGHGTAPISNVEDVDIPESPMPKTVFCRSCGAAIFETTAVCGNCGTPQGAGAGGASSGAPGGGPSAGGTSFADTAWTFGGASMRLSAGGLAPLSAAPDLTYQDSYYSGEFKAIYESGEQYKGRWNWAAFIFGPFWMLARDMTMLGVVVLIADIVLTALIPHSMGAISIAYRIYLGLRGNYLRYVALYKRVQALVE